MLRIWKLIACSIAASLALFASAMAQNLEVKRYNPSEWTKGRFSEIVTVNGPVRPSISPGSAPRRKTPPPAPALRSATMATPTSSANTPTTRSSGRSRPMAARWLTR